MEQASDPGVAKGCLVSFFGLLLGFAALQGGIVLLASCLHFMLAEGSFTAEAITGALVGLVLALMSPRLCLATAGSLPQVTWQQGAAALPDLLLAGWFILGWAAPQTIGRQAASLLVGIMVLEFIIIHASVMLVSLPEQFAKEGSGGRWWKTPAGALAGLAAMYSLFAAGISAAFGTVWLFLGFWMLIGNKFIGDWLAPQRDREARKQEHMVRWATSAALYLFLAFGSVFIPVPRLAATSGSRGDGLWEQNPEQAIAMGAMYFALLGFFELYGGFRRARLEGARQP
jgi:hypothetical protein